MTQGGDPLALLNRTFDQFERILAGVTPDQATRSTPCEGWDVRALMSHVLGGLARMGAAFSGATPPAAPGGQPAQPPEVPPAEWASTFRARKDALLNAARQPGALERRYQTPLGELPGSAFAGIITTEYTIHAWDLARATGQTDKLDQSIAETLLPMVQRMLPPERRGPGQPFAQEVPVLADAPAYDRLAGFLGRQV